MLDHRRENAPQRRFSMPSELYFPFRSPQQPVNSSTKSSNKSLHSSKGQSPLLFADSGSYTSNVDPYLDQPDAYYEFDVDDGYDLEEDELLELSITAIDSTSLEYSSGYVELKNQVPPSLSVGNNLQQSCINQPLSGDSPFTAYKVVTPSSSSTLTPPSSTTTVSTTRLHTRPTITRSKSYSISTAKSSNMASDTPLLSTFVGAFNDPSPTALSSVASNQKFFSHLDSQTSSFVHDHHHEYQPPSSQSVSPPAQAHDPNETDLERQRRISAEEDKRRRNTAASARFRIKKKQRDQEMARRAREQADRVNDLEKKISQLELENKWLRNLLVEKKS